MNIATIEHLTFWQSFAVIFAVGLILVWLGLVVYWLHFMLKKYTFNNEYDNPYRNETLGLPGGTMRGVLTLTILFVVVVLISLSMVVRQLQGTFEHLVDAFEVMLAFYFGSKMVKGISKADNEKSAVKYDYEVRKAEVEAKSKFVGGKNIDEFHVEGAQG